MFRTVNNPGHSSYGAKPGSFYRKPTWRPLIVHQPKKSADEVWEEWEKEEEEPTTEDGDPIRIEPKGAYGDGGFWRVAQNSQALGRYNGIRRNRAAGGGSMPYGMIGLGAVPTPILAIGAVFLAVSIYWHLDQNGYI